MVGAGDWGVGTGVCSGCQSRVGALEREGSCQELEEQIPILTGRGAGGVSGRLQRSLKPRSGGQQASAPGLVGRSWLQRLFCMGWGWGRMGA